MAPRGPGGQGCGGLFGEALASGLQRLNTASAEVIQLVDTQHLDMDIHQLNPYWEKLEIAMKGDPPVIVPK